MKIKKEIIFDYTNKANKFFIKHLEVRDIFERNIIDYLKNNKNNIDIKKLKGNDFYYRMRIGKYRIIYMVINQEIVIVKVISASSRGDIYKKI